MASSVISIDGIKASGRHGADPAERLGAQEFVVDVEVWVEVAEDSLESTLDYRIVVDTVRETVANSSFELLESLAEAVASSIFEFEPTIQVTAVVHKPGAASSLGVGDVSAEFTVGE